ncbi:general transcription factor IIH [Cavenderia fasciculata]|uniref:General transcription factor IIH subunit 4 n=1 Tax=Cavenderia fasciculata TaxID=261658 RepID=F4PTB5_CACFS|nr:general transcription factor IIH [Cavenderia fasciculata]EGG21637.1 general transcription factor IIH [Cavenderia fasciculata]|eukprot:XP_004359487.1 general transcription factor IIH [Cavenderia fasciculata]
MKIFQYLSSLPENEIQDLYSDAFTCRAVLRSLPPRAKQYLMRLLVVDSISMQSVYQWTTQSSIQAHKDAIRKLLDLKILTRVPNPKGVVSQDQLFLNQRFKDNIKDSLTDLDSVVLKSVKDNQSAQQHIKPMTVEELDKYSKGQWEKVLYYLSDEGKAPPELVSDLLLSSNLTKKNGTSIAITSEGFKFMLKDIYTQIWTLIIVYLNTLESRGRPRKEALIFLFKLSFLTLGKSYYLADLNPNQRDMLFDLKEFGLVYVRSEKSDVFYPTRLAISLATGRTVSLMNDLAQEISTSQKDQGYLILETNFRIYAYTQSSLQISLISLFVKMLYRLPNLAVGILTRESVRSALLHGITADQIVDFVKQNAHPNMVISGYPEVVFEQIRLWESERNRITYKKAVLFDSFPNAESFSKTVTFAKDQYFLVWFDETKKMLVVNDEGSEPIRNYIKKNFT